jgi:CRISPR system Cascade subunit CasE
MFLSRLILNPRGKAVQRDVTDCQQLHRTIMSAFPRALEGEGPREHLGVLYRIEESRRTGYTSIIVQSKVKPDWSRLEAGYLLETDDGAENPACRSIDELLGQIRQGMVLRFRLMANPTRKICTKSGPDGRRRHGKRVDLRDERLQTEWLRRKGLQGGFELLSVTTMPGVADVRTTLERKVTGLRVLADNEKTPSVPRKLTFQGVTFDGLLKVVDVDKFREALEGGVGPAKAYGFGLLSVVPHRDSL